MDKQQSSLEVVIQDVIEVDERTGLKGSAMEL